MKIRRIASGVSAGTTVLAMASFFLSMPASLTTDAVAAANEAAALRNVGACAPAPLTTCNGIDSVKSSGSLDIKAVHDGSAFVPGKGKLDVRIKGLFGASLADLGAPGGTATTDAVMTDDLVTCVYDDGVPVLGVEIDASTATWDCNRDATCEWEGSAASGLVGVQLTADTDPDDGKESSAIRVRASSKGATGGLSVVETDNPWGAGANPDVFDGVTRSIVVQLVNQTSGACWSVDFGGDAVGVDSSETKSVGISSGKPRLKAKVKITPKTCPASENPQCTECGAGSRLAGTICVACTPVTDCLSGLACTTDTDSQCAQCASGHWLDESSPADACPDCTSIPDCTEETCTNASDSVCVSCDSGHFVSGTTCALCTDIQHCGVQETCSTAFNSRCVTCNQGYWRNASGASDICETCTDVNLCSVSETCTTATDSRCGECAFGYYPENSGMASLCTPCTEVDHCSIQGSCSTSSDSRCVECDAGYYLHDNGTGDECRQCPSVAHCASPSSVTCTTALDSFCPACEQPGYYQQVNAFGGSDCPACTEVDHCATTETCLSATDSQCNTCVSGYYLDETTPADRCLDCTDIAGCVDSETCTTASNSQCTSCATGRYLNDVPPGGPSADSCPTCTQIPNCASEVCTGPGSSICAQCEAGYRLSGNTCVLCTDVAQCAVQETCTTASDSECATCDFGYFSNEGGSGSDTCDHCTDIAQCMTQESCTTASDSRCDVCASGFYRHDDGPSDSCQPCSPVEHCVSSLTCTNAFDSNCTACEQPGFYLSTGVGGASTCEACTEVAHCTSELTCVTADSSQCSSCEFGYYLDETTLADRCQECTTIAGCTSPAGCTTPSNSQCTGCATGRYLNDVAPGGASADSCPTCTPIPGCMGTVVCTNASDSVCL